MVCMFTELCLTFVMIDLIGLIWDLKSDAYSIMYEHQEQQVKYNL
jgi:hypothetical protein